MSNKENILSMFSKLGSDIEVTGNNVIVDL